MRFVTVGEGDMIQKVNKLFQMYKYLYNFIEKPPTVTHFLLAQVSQIPQQFRFVSNEDFRLIIVSKYRHMTPSFHLQLNRTLHA